MVTGSHHNRLGVAKPAFAVIASSAWRKTARGDEAARQESKNGGNWSGAAKRASPLFYRYTGHRVSVEGSARGVNLAPWRVPDQGRRDIHPAFVHESAR